MSVVARFADRAGILVLPIDISADLSQRRKNLKPWHYFAKRTMTNLNSADTKICDKALTPLSPLEVIEFAIKVGRHIEKVHQVNKDLDRLAEVATAQLRESKDTQYKHEHQQNISEQRQLFEG